MWLYSWTSAAAVADVAAVAADLLGRLVLLLLHPLHVAVHGRPVGHLLEDGVDRRYLTVLLGHRVDGVDQLLLVGGWDHAVVVLRRAGGLAALAGRVGLV